PAADVFSLGAILYECLAGAAPFEGPTALETLARVTEGRFEPLRARRPEVPLELAVAIEKALAPEPGERFVDGVAFARALSAQPRSRSGRALAVGALIALLAAASALGAALVGRSGAASRPLSAPSPKLTPPSPSPPSSSPSSDGDVGALYARGVAILNGGDLAGAAAV